MSACRLLLVVLLCGVRVGQWSENAKLFCIVDLLLSVAGLCVVTADTVPESGSVIGELEGTQNVSIYCASRSGDSLIQTIWLKETLEDREAGRGGELISLDDNFILSGEAINLTICESVPSNTNLTIVSLTTDLQHVIIHCGSANGILANFPLEVYGKGIMSMYMYITNMACGPAHGVTI